MLHDRELDRPGGRAGAQGRAAHRAGAGALQPAAGVAAPCHPERIFAACAPGLEAVLAAELEALGLTARPLAGGVEATGEDAAAVACLGSRVAETVRIRCFDGPAGDLGRARAEALAAPRPRRRAPRPARGRAGHPLGGGRPASRSSSAAGGPASARRRCARRWRPACSWPAAGTGDRRFLDPMCGSGTIAIEAALLAGRPRARAWGAPSPSRRFPATTPPHRAGAGPAGAEARPVTAPVHASDRNMGALRLAQKNAAAAGVADAHPLRARRRRRGGAAAGRPGALPHQPALRRPARRGRAPAPGGRWRALARRLAGWEVAAPSAPTAASRRCCATRPLRHARGAERRHPLPARSAGAR